MKRLIMIAVMAIGVFSFSEASAQKVIKDASGKVYIDVQDMPAGTWSSSPLSGVHNEKSATNSLFKRIEVDKSDLAENANWAAATANCAAKGWRLPTQRELMLLNTMKGVLKIAGVDMFAEGASYWSSTDNNSNSAYAWYSNGGTYNDKSKNTIFNVRCVREVLN